MVAKYWCKMCKVWVHDNIAMRTAHEKNQKHKDAMSQYLSEQFDASAKRKEEREDLEKELARINRTAAEAHTTKDGGAVEAPADGEPKRKRRKLYEEPAPAVPSRPAQPPADRAPQVPSAAPAFGAPANSKPPAAAGGVRELPPAPASAAELARLIAASGAADSDDDSDSEEAPVVKPPAADAAAPAAGAVGFGAPAGFGAPGGQGWTSVTVTKLEEAPETNGGGGDDDIDSDEERYGKSVTGKTTMRGAVPSKCRAEEDALLDAADKQLAAVRGDAAPSPAAPAVEAAPAAAPAPVAFRRRKKAAGPTEEEAPAAPGGESVATTITKVGRNGRARHFRRKVDDE